MTAIVTAAILMMLKKNPHVEKIYQDEVAEEVLVVVIVDERTV